MYQKIYSLMKCGRLFSLGLISVVLSACQSFYPEPAGYCRGADCAARDQVSSRSQSHSQSHSNSRSSSEGLVVGAVVNAEGRSALAAHERWRYTDQLASRILQVNPQLTGSVDSYQYFSQRVGKPIDSILKNYRLAGELNSDDLNRLRDAQLRRRYLMLASIQPTEESVQLRPDAEPVIGALNREVQDYKELKRHTVLFTTVRVQVYDTHRGRKISDEIVRSDDGGQTLATESISRQYVGNSVLASISNSIANGLTGSAAGAYPAPPARDDVLAFVWGRVAEKLPRRVF